MICRDDRRTVRQYRWIEKQGLTNGSDCQPYAEAMPRMPSAKNHLLRDVVRWRHQ
jgi:hypothetical protein